MAQHSVVVDFIVEMNLTIHNNPNAPPTAYARRRLDIWMVCLTGRIL